MVSRAEFSRALAAAKLPVLSMLIPSVAVEDAPNVQISRTGDGAPEPVVAALRRRLVSAVRPPKDWASQPPAAKAAVASAKDSLERRVAQALQGGLMLEGPDLVLAIAGATAVLDSAGFPSHNRFGLMSDAVWRKTERNDPEFASALPVMGGRYWRGLIWLRNPHLEAQATVFHASALSGGIEPFEPSPGQAASASVRALLVNPEAARVLRWGAPAQSDA